VNLFEHFYGPTLICVTQKWTKAKKDIYRKTGAQIRFLRATVGRTRRNREQ
jgi:hypothetical protein